MVRLSDKDSRFFSYLRAVSIFVIVFGHVGGFWIYRPYSEFLHVFVAVFFFISGAVNANALASLTPFQFIAKRLLALYTPYILLCSLVLIFYLATRMDTPLLSYESLWRWVTIIPLNSLSPFPVGQVWFLHALALIVVIAPILHGLFLNQKKLLACYLAIVVLLASAQLFFDLDDYFFIALHNLYQPLIHSVFFVFGFIYVGLIGSIRRTHLCVVAVVCVIFECLLTLGAGYSIDYSEHTYAPDIVYLLGCFAAIAIILMCKNSIVEFFGRSIIFTAPLDFLFKHTFSIFLIHSFVIFLADDVVGIKSFFTSSIVYAVAKLVFVLIGTALLAVPFSWLSGLAIKFIQSKPDRLKKRN